MSIINKKFFSLGKVFAALFYCLYIQTKHRYPIYNILIKKLNDFPHINGLCSDLSYTLHMYNTENTIVQRTPNTQYKVYKLNYIHCFVYFIQIVFDLKKKTFSTALLYIFICCHLNVLLMM